MKPRSIEANFAVPVASIQSLDKELEVRFAHINWSTAAGPWRLNLRCEMPNIATTKNQGFLQTVLAASDQQGSSCSMKKSRQQTDQGSSLARVVFLVVVE